jgi:translocation and assembly module TamB
VRTSKSKVGRASQAAIAVALIAAAAFLAAPRLDSAVRTKVESALDAFRSLAWRETGLELSFGSLSPSILDTLSISDLVVRSPRGTSLLEAQKVFIHYDLLSLARGDVSRAITALRIESVRIDIDTDADKELLQRLERLVSGGSGGNGTALSVSGRDVAIRIASPGTAVAMLDAREFHFAPSGDEMELSLSGEYSVEPRSLGLGTIHGPFTVSGSLSRDASRARLELGIAAIARDLSLRTQRFELAYTGKRVELRKVGDQAPIDAEIALDLSDGSLSARMLLDGFVPDRSFKVAGRLAWLSPWLATPYSGSLTLSVPKGDYRRISYTAKIEGSLPPKLVSRRLHAALSASGDASGIDIEDARLTEGDSSFAYRGYFGFKDSSPDGELDLRLSLFDGRLPVASSVRVYGHEGEYIAFTEKADIADTSFRDLTVAAAWRGNQIDFRLSFLPPESAAASPDSESAALPVSGFAGEAIAGTGAAPLVRCEGSAAMGTNPSLDFSVSLESLDLGPMRRIFEAVFASEQTAAFLSGLRLGGEIYLSSDFHRFSWSAPDLAVVSRSMPGAYALLSLSGNTTSISVRKASFSLAGYDIEGEGKLDFGQRGVLALEAGFRLRDVPYTLHGSLVGGSLSLFGDYGLSISARKNDDGGTVVSFATKELPIPVGGGQLLVSAEADARFVTAREWSLVLSSFSIVPMGEKLARVPRIAAMGAFGPDGGDIREIRVNDKYSSMTGSALVGYSTGPSGTAPKATLALSIGAASTEEHYDLDLAYSAGNIEGTLDFLASPIARLGELPVKGSIDGKASLSGKLDDPNLGFEAELRNATYRDQRITAKAVGSFAAGRVSIRDASVSYREQAIQSASCSFSLRDASASASFSFSGIFGGERLSLSFEAEGASLEKGGRSLQKMLGSYELGGKVKNFKYGTASVESWPFNASFSPTAGFALEGGPGGELALSYAPDGTFDLGTQKPLPIRLHATGKIASGEIEADAEGVELDMPLFSLLFDPEDLQFLAGTAKGNLRVRGLLADPEMNGQLDVYGALLRVPGWIGDPIGPFDAPVLVEGRNLSSSAPYVPVGKAAVTYRAQAGLDHWLPLGLKAVIRSLEGGFVKLETAFLGIQIDGDASFELNAEFRGDTVFLGGAVALQKAVVVVSPEGWAAKASATGVSPKRSSFLSVDMAVDLARGVNVIFPSKDLPIVSGYADKSSELSVRYDESTNDLLLKGTVLLRGGDVFYIQRNFFLKSARIVFNETMDRFEPRVTVLAELRDRNENGPVTITLSAEDAPMTSFQPHLSSDPTMTEAQIAALLGQSLLGIGSSDGELDVRKAVISGSEFIPQLNVAKAFESRVRDALGLDIFYFKTQVLQRWLIDLSGQSDTTSTENPLGRYLDETSIYAGKYLGDSVFIYGLARLSEDEDPLVRSGGLSLDSELGVEFDTPFGLLQWTVEPNSPESLFISDQSLSISWKLSF